MVGGLISNISRGVVTPELSLALKSRRNSSSASLSKVPQKSPNGSNLSPLYSRQANLPRRLTTWREICSDLGKNPYRHGDYA